jgi:hypothetical protein
MLPVDADGVTSRFDERIEVHNGTVATLAGQMARALGRPIVSHGVIDFAAGAAFDFIPLQSALEWYDAGDANRLERAFGGKAVLLGSVLKFEDRLVAPVNLATWDPGATNAPGVLLHAQALRNMLTRIARPRGFRSSLRSLLLCSGYGPQGRPRLALLATIGDFLHRDIHTVAGEVSSPGPL